MDIFFQFFFDYYWTMWLGGIFALVFHMEIYKKESGMEYKSSNVLRYWCVRGILLGVLIHILEAIHKAYT